MLGYSLDMKSTLDAIHADASFFGHPRGLATCFFTEMWERFSYYGMRAILILFMTASVAKGGLGFSVVKAGAIYGFYTAMVYLLSLPGGWVADRIFGQRRAVLYGGILIVAGEFALMSPGVSGFYVGLGLLIFGTGMLKPNVSTMVGQLYAQNDRRRDSGFSIFYMGINLGGLLSPLACGWVGERINWRLGFGLAGVGMVAGLIQYMLGAKYLGTAGLHPATEGDPAAARRAKRNAGLSAAAGASGVGSDRNPGGDRSDRDYGGANFGGARNRFNPGVGGDFRVAAAGAGLVGDRAKAVGRDSGAVCGVGGVLGGV